MIEAVRVGKALSRENLDKSEQCQAQMRSIREGIGVKGM